MIRIVSSLFAFAVLLCGWIVYQTANDAQPGTPDVTRAETGDLLNSPAASTAVTYADPTNGGLLPDLSNATIAPVPMQNSAADKILAATNAGATVAPRPTIRTDNTTIAQTTAGVLAGLGVQVAAPAPQNPNDPLLQQTQAALSGIQNIRGIAAAPSAPAVPQPGLQSLVAEALKQGQSDAYIDALLNEAAAAGQVSVPQMLVTSDGRVDTAVLLASIVAQATVAAGGQAPAMPDVVGGEGVEVRVVQRADQTEQYRFYTVNPGDSLGSIAVKFFSSVEYYPQIFEANRQILSSPDRIQSGQRLVIPQIG